MTVPKDYAPLCAEFISQKQGVFLPSHCHPTTHVRLLINSGTAIVEVEGYQQIHKEGDKALIPAGFRHSLFAQTDVQYTSLHFNETLSVNHDLPFPNWPKLDELSVEYSAFAGQLLTAFLSLQTDKKSWFFLVHVDASKQASTIPGIGAKLSLDEWGGWALEPTDAKCVKDCRVKATARPFLLSSFLDAARRHLKGTVPNRFIACRNQNSGNALPYDFSAFHDSANWSMTVSDELNGFLTESSTATLFKEYLDYVLEPHLADAKTYLFFTPPTYPSSIYRSFTNLAVGSQADDPAFFVALQSFYLKVVSMLQQHEFSKYERILRKHAEHSARAAIMSRNLSHNVGSHALANSRFFESVGILHEVPSTPTDRASGDDNEKDGGIFRHRKTNFPLRKGEVWRARQRLGTFNSFIQGRLDFIARALTETSNTPEPMFFFGDLVQGFFSQRILLNTLLSDNGITIEDIEFQIVLPGMTEPAVYQGVNDKHDSQLRHVQFRQVNGGFLSVGSTHTLKDLLIAVPGGMIGRHAFYAFLENIMRNAAKYGRKPEGEEGKNHLVIRMEVKDGLACKRGSGGGCTSIPCYWLEIMDNRSLDITQAKRGGREIKGKVARTIRRYLNDPIITAEGKPQSEGHGIQEMKVCADFLASETLCFPKDDTISVSTDWVDQDYTTFIASQEQELNQDKDAQRKRNSGITTEENSLQAWDRSLDGKLQQHKNGQPHLAYRLILQKPVIFGIVNKYARSDNGETEDIRQAEQNASVHYYKDIEILAKNSAHFGLIIATSDGSISEIMKEVAKYHYALPYRLMVVVPPSKNDKLRTKIQDAINQFSAGPGRPFEDGILPIRRLFAVTCPDLFLTDANLTCANAKIASFDQESGLNAFKQVSEAWLKAWKGHESAHWGLWVGFDRAGNALGSSLLKDKWSALNSFASEVVSVLVRDTGGTEVKSKVYSSDRIEKKSLIIYDNHGKAFGNQDALGTQPKNGICDAHACYHEFSGSGQIDLFHCLETPPQDSFGFAFLVYSLLEASLLTVAVVDERVGEAMIEENRLFSKKHKDLQLARVYPLFQVRCAGTEFPNPKALSPSIEAAVKSIDKSVTEKESGEKGFMYSHDDDRTMGNAEGLTLINPNEKHCEHDQSSNLITPFLLHDCSVKRKIAHANFLNNIRSDHIDALVVHEGVLDSIRDWWGKSSNQAETFFQCTPCFVRTSGRGSASRHAADHLPFLEFTELSDTTYQSQNKLSLGRSILGLRGKLKK